YDGWYDLEQRSEGGRLLAACPCLSLGPSGSELIAGVCRSAEEHGLPVERLSRDEVMRRWPVFRLPDGYAAVVEHGAGILYAHECLEALEGAGRINETYWLPETVARAWGLEKTGVWVETDRGRYTAGKLVLTAGPWAGQVLGHHGTALRVMRQAVLYSMAADRALFRRDRFSIFLADPLAGALYR